ncbi:hypothetical protein ABIB30_004369 [Pedobacter sp. UYP1]
MKIRFPPTKKKGSKFTLDPSNNIVCYLIEPTKYVLYYLFFKIKIKPTRIWIQQFDGT